MLLQTSRLRMVSRLVSFLLPAFLLAGLAVPRASATADHIVIGLDADMSSGAAQGGEAIRRGAEVAIREINARGGVLNRRLQLEVRDHRGNPARGKDNILEFAAMDNLAAVIGGIHTPVALAELDLIHKHQIIYLGAWAAGTPVVQNGQRPNYVFRVSVRDAFAGEFLLRAATDRGFRAPGLLLERTGWGRSNVRAFVTAAQNRGIRIALIQWFNWGVKDLRPQTRLLKAANADVVLLVANPREGGLLVRTMASAPKDKRLPIISHWGITGADFPDLVGENLNRVNLSFLQTYSFLTPTYPDRAANFLKQYYRLFPPASSPRHVTSPVGTAHAYDLVHLLAKAIKQAGTTKRAAVRDALEKLPPHAGLVRDYAPAFTPKRHDALTTADFSLARYAPDGAIVPVTE